MPGLSCSRQELSCVMWDLFHWPGIKPRAPALGAQSLNHWTTRNIPHISFSNSHFKFSKGFLLHLIHSPQICMTWSLPFCALAHLWMCTSLQPLLSVLVPLWCQPPDIHTCCFLFLEHCFILSFSNSHSSFSSCESCSFYLGKFLDQGGSLVVKRESDMIISF